MSLYSFNGQTIWPVLSSDLSTLSDLTGKYISCPEEHMDKYSGMCPKEHWIYRTKKEFDEEQKCLHFSKKS